MKITEQIEHLIESQPPAKRDEMLALHELVLQIAPDCRLWLTDGKNAEGKAIANPNIGYGTYTIRYADRSTKEFYRVGLSANKTGISVYILGLDDKAFLAETYGKQLGKAKVTGYCIHFRTIKDINLDVLRSAIAYRLTSLD